MDTAIALVALAFSIYVWRRGEQTRKSGEKTRLLEDKNRQTIDELQQKLLAHQVKLIEQAEEAAKQADVELAVRPGSRDTYRLWATNRGDGVAFQTTIEVVPVGGGESAFLESELREKLPVDLNPNDEISFVAAPTMGCALEYEVVVRWSDPNGRPRHLPRRIELRS